MTTSAKPKTRELIRGMRTKAATADALHEMIQDQHNKFGTTQSTMGFIRDQVLDPLAEMYRERPAAFDLPLKQILVAAMAAKLQD